MDRQVPKKEPFEQYVDALGCLFDKDVALTDIVGVFADIHGEDRIRKMLKEPLNGAWTRKKHEHLYSNSEDSSDSDSVLRLPRVDTTELSQYHERLISLPKSSKTGNKTDEILKDDYKNAHQVLSIKPIICIIFSLVEPKTFARCCRVSRQWFHDSFSTACNEVLDLTVLNKTNKYFLDKALTRYAGCKKLIGRGSYDVWQSLMKNWHTLGALDTVDIKIDSSGKSILRQLGLSCEDIRYLKINDKGPRRTLDADVLLDCTFSKLLHLQLIGSVPLVFCDAEILQTLILDADHRQMGDVDRLFSEWSEYLGEDAVLPNLREFELTIRYGSRSRSQDDEDQKLMSDSAVRALARFVCCVSKLKLHCPYINVFKLLQEIATATFKPEPNHSDRESTESGSIDETSETEACVHALRAHAQLEKLDIRLEQVDNSGTLCLDKLDSLKSLKTVSVIIGDDWDIEDTSNLANVRKLLTHVEMVRFEGSITYRSYYRPASNVRSPLKTIGTLLDHMSMNHSNCLKYVRGRCARLSNVNPQQNSFEDVMNFLEALQRLSSKNCRDSLFIDFHLNFEQDLSFSELLSGVPKFVESLSRLARNSFIDLRVLWPGRTPRGIFDEYVDLLEESLKAPKKSDLQTEIGKKVTPRCVLTDRMLVALENACATSVK